MDRQARTGDTLLVKSREMRDEPNTAMVAGGGGGKDDRRKNTLTLLYETRSKLVGMHWL
jgi:hypothetical protein